MILNDFVQIRINYEQGERSSGKKAFVINEKNSQSTAQNKISSASDINRTRRIHNVKCNVIEEHYLLLLT